MILVLFQFAWFLIPDCPPEVRSIETGIVPEEHRVRRHEQRSGRCLVSI